MPISAKIGGQYPAITTVGSGDDCCQAPPCSDKAANCAENTRLCTDTLYASLMAEQCAKSCGKCSNFPDSQPVYGNCGVNRAMSIGPCASQVAACGTGDGVQEGYACDITAVSCCPTVDTIDHSYELGPAVSTMCAVGYIAVYGTVADRTGDGICIAPKSVPESTYVPSASTATTPSPNICRTDPDCERWIRNGFCTTAYYTTAQKRAYCGIGCGLCSG